jgi:hypothetical protein
VSSASLDAQIAANTLYVRIEKCLDAFDVEK